MFIGLRPSLRERAAPALRLTRGRLLPLYFPLPHPLQLMTAIVRADVRAGVLFCMNDARGDSSILAERIRQPRYCVTLSHVLSSMDVAYVQHRVD
jgi:hypothetical protein